jgi:hypothetical protein
LSSYWNYRECYDNETVAGGTPDDDEPVAAAIGEAAALELLAACVEVEAWIAETMRDEEELAWDAQAILATVRAAIARAGGAS